MNDKYFAIIPACVVAFIAVYGICLCFGKLSKLIPGYNAKATDENAAFFEKIYCKKVGLFVLPLTLFAAGIFCGLMFHIVILAVASAVVGVLYFLGGTIYLKNDTRTRRVLYLAKELEKNPKGLSPEELEHWKNKLSGKEKEEK